MQCISDTDHLPVECLEHQVSAACCPKAGIEVCKDCMRIINYAVRSCVADAHNVCSRQDTTYVQMRTLAV